MKKEDAPRTIPCGTDPGRTNDLLARLERMLADEGLVDLNPPPRRCRFCREIRDTCIDYEGRYLKGAVCSSCYGDVDYMEYVVAERGKDLERHVVTGGRNFFFLEDRELWLIDMGKGGMKRLSYFEPFGIGYRALVRKLRTYLVFL